MKFPDLNGARPIDEMLMASTFVYQIFGGNLCSQITCSECHQDSDTFDSILDINLGICHQRSIDKALAAFMEIDLLEGSDQYMCHQ
jgi:ubiquitin carboxyl-terminal hydrolase 36/42